MPLSLDLLGLKPEIEGKEEPINVLELIINTEKGEFVPEFDPHVFLETQDDQIKAGFEFSPHFNLDEISNLKLLGYNTESPEIKKMIDDLISDIFSRNSIFDMNSQTNLAMNLRILKPVLVSNLMVGIYREGDMRWFDEQLLLGNRSLHYLIKLTAATVGATLVEKFEEDYGISDKLVAQMAEWGHELKGNYIAVANFLGVATALKEIFPEKLPEITEEQWEALIETLVDVQNLTTFEKVQMATDMYVLASEKAEFTEKGLVITPRKKAPSAKVDTPKLPEIRRF